ncbi:MAG: hypothetical protein Q7R95_00290 [bacterium]|nr:hypothetical protein [bacterium]
MKKFTKDNKGKTVKELEKMAQMLREEIAKSQLHEKVNPSKDTNMLKKKKKQLAAILSMTTEKKELEKLQNTKK